MKSILSISLGCVLAAFATASWIQRDVAGGEPAKTRGVDPSRPETWEAAVAEVKKQENAVVKALVSVAKDEKRDWEERRKAIFALSGLRTRRSLDYLIANVSLRLPGAMRVTAADLAKELPCKYVLSERCDWGTEDDMHGFPPEKRTDWGTAQAIIYGLDDGVRTPSDLMYLSRDLELILGRELATAAVDLTLKQWVPAGDCPWRRNLTAIHTYLKH